jgi:hypothetical protein
MNNPCFRNSSGRIYAKPVSYKAYILQNNSYDPICFFLLQSADKNI